MSPPAGMVSWWRGEATALDSAGTNDGMVIDGIRFTTGLVGLAFAFSSGSGDDYVALPAEIFPMPVSGTNRAPFSFETWFATTSAGALLGQQDVFPFGQRIGGYVPALYVGTNGLLYAQLFWGTGSQLASTNAVNDGMFHHTAVTYDGTNEILYVDGQVVGTTPFVQRAYANTYRYQMGTAFTGGWQGAPGGWFPFTGVIDEPAIYNRALDPSEIASIFSAGSSGKCIEMARPLLRHRYSFNSPAGDSAIIDRAGYTTGHVAFASSAAPWTNGVPDGTAMTGNGALRLAGTNGFVSLPSGVVSPFTSVTFEIWATALTRSPEEQSVFIFGANGPASTPVSNASNYLSLVRLNAGNQVAFAATTNIAAITSNAAALKAPDEMAAGSPTYVAVTYDPVDSLAQIYVNGKLSAVAYQPLASLGEFEDVNDSLGGPPTGTGKFFHGDIDEFRLWEGVLRPEQIAEHFAAGPDQVIPARPPSLTIDWLPSQVVVSWRADLTAGFDIQSRSALQGDWHTVTNGVTRQKSILRLSRSPAEEQEFFRLKR